MRHRKSHRKLGRNSSHRKAMLRNMVTSLFEHGRIQTTDTRAKELRVIADRLVTLGKKNTVHAKRRAARTLQSRDVLVKLFDEIAPGFDGRHGGYTRIIKIGRRHGDAAPVSVIELMPAGAVAGGPSRSAKLSSTAAVPVTKERFDEDQEG